MEFDKQIKKIVDDSYGGDVDKFLHSLKMKTIMFLVFGGFCLLFSMMVYKSTGGNLPIVTLTIGIIFMIIGMLSHFMYNESFKALN